MSDTESITNPAFDYINKGFPVFPLDGKKPFESGGFKTATTSTEKIQEWITKYPGCNWGIPTGPVSGFDVLDIDGDAGHKSLDMWRMQYGDLPRTPWQITGSGGIHFLFKASGTVRNSAKAMMPGWDTRGEGGYIVVAPSIHPDTKQPYEWQISPLDEDFAEWPAELLEAYDKASRERTMAEPGGTILHGTQEAELMRLIGSMRGQGMTATEILAAVRVVSAERCDPPVKEKDLRRMVESGCRYEPNDPMLSIERTDRGWGLRLALHAEGRMLYDPRSRVWYTWRKDRWVDYETAAQLEVDILVDTFLQEAYAMPRSTNEEMVERELMVKYAGSGRTSKIQGVILAQGQRFLPGSFSDFDSSPHLMNLANGVLDLDTQTVHEHSPEFLQMQYSPVRYIPGARSPYWESFLERAAPVESTRRYLQRVVGYTLFGRNTEQVLMILHGPPSTGKSTFISAIQGIFGSYGKNVEMSSFSDKPRTGATGDIARLAGARLVTSGEADGSMKLSDSLIKRLTGGERITARHLFQGEIEFTPGFTMWWATNDTPNTTPSPEIQRRLRIVPFDTVIPREEWIEGLGYMFQTLPEHQEAILAWAVEGYRMWKEEGLGWPEQISDAAREFVEERNPLIEFIEDMCVMDEGQEVESSFLYNKYIEWCEHRNEKFPMGSRLFGKMLKYHTGIEKVRLTGTGDRRPWGYRGINLNAEARKVTGFSRMID